MKDYARFEKLASGHNSDTSNKHGREDMGMEERRASEFIKLCDKGHVLLAALMVIFLLGLPA